MPLVTRNANVSSYYKGTTAQESTQTFTEGDLWYNTQTDIVKSYDGSALNRVGSTNFAGAAVVSHSTTIGDYTQPTTAIASSPAAVTYVEQDTARIDGTSSTVVYDVQNDDQSNNGLSWDLGANLSDTLWCMRFKLVITTLTQTGGQAQHIKLFVGVGDSASTTSPTSNQDAIGISGLVNNTVKRWSASTNDGAALGPETTNFTRAIAAETLYVQIARTSSTAYAVSLYSDSGYSTLLESQTSTCAATCVSLRYVKVQNTDIGQAASTHQLNGTVSDIQIDDGSATFVAATYTNVGTALDAVDGSTTTKWTSSSENNPNIYVDMGSALNLCAVAFYWNGTNSTETEIKIQSSSDANTWTDKRKITTSNLTNAAWNYYRFNIAGGSRYIRLYGTGTSKVLSNWEIKVLKKTDAEIFADLGILEISASDTSLDGEGL